MEGQRAHVERDDKECLLYLRDATKHGKSSIHYMS